MVSLTRALLVLVALTSTVGCFPYKTKIHDVIDLRRTTSGRHEPIREVEIEQTRAWALAVFTYKHVDVGEQLKAQLDDNPSAGLRNVTWESQIGLHDFFRWLGINGALAEVAVARQVAQGTARLIGQPLPEEQRIPPDRTFQFVSTALFGPLNVLIVSRTLRVSAEVVTLDRRDRMSGAVLEDLEPDEEDEPTPTPSPSPK